MTDQFVATYRIQLRSGIGFKQVEKLLIYLKELGISHIYFSPYLQAMPESTHGYDVVDPTSVDISLGGKKAHAKLCERLKELNLGQVIDIVPNHMAISKGENPWWWDVLENGSSSRFASFFDVDWDVSGDRWPNKVLLPVLGDQYGKILEQKKLHLTFNDAIFILHYENHLFPIDPSSLGELLQKSSRISGSDELAFLGESFDRLPKPKPQDRERSAHRDRDKRVIQDMLVKLCKKEPNVLQAIQQVVLELNQDPDALDGLIERQNYRLAFWKTANRDLGYRRFFDIKDLVGLRVEDPQVFAMLHALAFSWVKKGWVQGLRIDHPDGLRYPTDYFQRLRKECPEIWIVAEKILEPGEELSKEWPIEGTTGYDFLQLAGGLFIDPKGKDPLVALYRDIIEKDISYKTIEHDSKLLVLTQILESELDRLTTLFVTICESHRLYRDYTRRDLREALGEVCATFGVYRTYVQNSASSNDEKVIRDAIEKAIHNRQDLDPELFLFLEQILVRKVDGAAEEELALRFQQLTGSVMAKGVEDTAFYRYMLLTALNEVGSNPENFGVSLDLFYKKCEEMQAKWPKTLLTTVTHDTKRSDDVRARLSLLSEIPDKWRDVSLGWFSHNKKYHTGGFPDANTEYLIYQTVVGAWPIEPKRLKTYLEKACREAKLYTTWTAPNAEYEQAIEHFIDKILADKTFIKNLQSFVGELLLPGRITSLSQQLIKCTAPGIPDIYQGSEVWDLTLVDPDNRRQVAFSKLEDTLKSIQDLDAKQILAGMDKGLPKLWVLYKSLAVRKQYPHSFDEKGCFSALYAVGNKKEHVIAYMRAKNIITVVPRLVLGIGGDWGDTKLHIPHGKWKNIFTNEPVQGGDVYLRELFALFPVTLLVQEK